MNDAALPPVMPDLFAPVADGYALLGGWCPRCDRHSYPYTRHCSTCQGGLERVPVGTRGTIYSYTVVRTKAPFGLPEPYAVGYVDLAESALRVFGLLDPEGIDGLAVGQRVQVAVRPLGVDNQGLACLRPVFCPGEAP